MAEIARTDRSEIEPAVDVPFLIDERKRTAANGLETEIQNK